MRPGASFWAWLLVFTIATPALAVFADEAYQIDYHHPLLGRPQPHTTFFHRPSVASKASLLYTLSVKGILGVINPKDGSTVWRQPLVKIKEVHTDKGLLVAGEDSNTVISAINGKIAAWDAADGKLVWEHKGRGTVKGLEILIANGESGDVFTLFEEGNASGLIKRLKADSGKVTWEFREDSGDIPLGISSFGSGLYYIALHSTVAEGFTLRVLSLDPASGKKIGLITLGSEKDVTSKELILHVGSVLPLLIWIDSSIRVLKINFVGTKIIVNFDISSIDNNKIEKVSVHAPRTRGAQTYFLVHYQARDCHWAEVYHVDVIAGTVRKVYDLPIVKGYGAFSTSTHSGTVYFIRHTNAEITLFSSISNHVLGQWLMHLGKYGGPADPPVVTYAVSEVVSKGVSKYAVRSALVLQSGDWELVRNGDSVWLRSESLAGAIAAVFCEPPKEKGLAEQLALESHSSLLKAYVHRLKRHISGIKDLPSIARSLSGRASRGLFKFKPSSEIQVPNRDIFGFRKLIVVATEQGRLIGLDTGNLGKVVWNVKIVDILAGERWEIIDMEVINGTASIRGNKGEFWRVQTSNGMIMHHEAGGMLETMKTAVSLFTDAGDLLVVWVKNDGSLAPFPKRRLAEGTYVVTRGTHGAVQGWSVTGVTDPMLAWEFLPQPDQTITNVIERPAHDHVASIGKALGDRNVLYKYLNPNLLLITTINPKFSSAVIYVLDSASGEILHAATHSNVDTSRTIAATITENWIAYSIFSDSLDTSSKDLTNHDENSRGFQLMVSEFFESSYPNHRGPMGTSVNFSSIHPLTSESGETPNIPYVISQAYLIPGPISHMAVTSTLQSITPRSLLCFLPSLNALISISRTILDPRRPVGRDPLPAELEEGLSRHNALLEFEPKWIINHKREIMSLSKIITCPSLLESTSLAFSFGDIDIFGTRIAPIGGFDILGKGFNKLQLVATVIALAIGTGVVAPMVRKKQINGRWRA